jgi:hypothetical protein
MMIDFLVVYTSRVGVESHSFWSVAAGLVGMKLNFFRSFSKSPFQICYLIWCVTSCPSFSYSEEGAYKFESVAVKFDSWKQAPCYDPVLNVGVLPCPQAFIDNLQPTRHKRSLPILSLS